MAALSVPTGQIRNVISITKGRRRKKLLDVKSAMSHSMKKGLKVIRLLFLQRLKCHITEVQKCQIKTSFCSYKNAERNQNFQFESSAESTSAQTTTKTIKGNKADRRSHFSVLSRTLLYDTWTDVGA